MSPSPCNIFPRCPSLTQCNQTKVVVSASTSHFSPPASGSLPPRQISADWCDMICSISVFWALPFSLGMEQWALSIASNSRRKEPLCFHAGNDLSSVYSWGWVGRTPASFYCLFVGDSPEHLFWWEHCSCLSSPWCKFCQFSDHFYELVPSPPTTFGYQPLILLCLFS